MTLTHRDNRISYGVVVLLALIIFITNYLHFPSNAISYDVFGYYLYLPQTFIYNDLALENYGQVENLIAQYKSTGSFYQVTMAPNGNWVMKYSMGMALLYLPFFLIAHCIALLSAFPADGFSYPYQVSLGVAGILYTIAGCWFLRKFLLRCFSDGITALTLFTILLGTNFYFHSSFHGQGTMTHNFLFAFYALILLESANWSKKPTMKSAIKLGVLCGLTVLARPSEIICLFIPLLWGVHNFKSLKTKINTLWNYKSHVLALAGVLGVIGSFQVIYWIWVSGKPLYYSYGGNAGEGFEFLSPYVVEVLFSFRKGWLVYTPLMSLALFGFYFLWRKQKQIFIPVLLFFLTNLYIVSSWSCWWYAESFSQRALIQSYAVLSLPLAYFLAWAFSKKNLIGGLIAVVIGGLVILNLFQTWQMANSVLHPSRMTKEAYGAIFGQTDLPEGYFDMLLVNREFEGEEKIPDTSKFTNSIIYQNTFDQPQDTFRYSTDGLNFTHALLLEKPMERSPEFRKEYGEITNNYFAWFRISVDVFPFKKGNPTRLVVCIEHNHYCYKYRTFDLNPDSISLQTWNRLSFDYLSPEIRRMDNELKVYVEHLGGQPVLIENLTIQAFE